MNGFLYGGLIEVCLRSKHPPNLCTFVLDVIFGHQTLTARRGVEELDGLKDGPVALLGSLSGLRDCADPTVQQPGLQTLEGLGGVAEACTRRPQGIPLVEAWIAEAVHYVVVLDICHFLSLCLVSMGRFTPSIG